MPTPVAGVGILTPFVRVSVFLHNTSKTNAARSTRFDTEIFHDQS